MPSFPRRIAVAASLFAWASALAASPVASPRRWALTVSRATHANDALTLVETTPLGAFVDEFCRRPSGCDALRWVKAPTVREVPQTTATHSPGAAICVQVPGAKFERGRRPLGGEVGLCHFRDGSHLSSADLWAAVRRAGAKRKRPR